MKFENFLVIDSYQRVTGSSGCFKAAVEAGTIFEIGKAIPMIIHKSGCNGIAVPYEIHMSKDMTIVFFTLVDERSYNRKMLKAFWMLYVMQTGSNETAATDSDTRRSGMSAAMRMNMGIDRDARDIARGRSMDEPNDYDGLDISDMLGMSNPGDSFFD